MHFVLFLWWYFTITSYLLIHEMKQFSHVNKLQFFHAKGWHILCSLMRLRNLVWIGGSFSMPECGPPECILCINICKSIRKTLSKLLPEQSMAETLFFFLSKQAERRFWQGWECTWYLQFTAYETSSKEQCFLAELYLTVKPLIESNGNHDQNELCWMFL